MYFCIYFNLTLLYNLVYKIDSLVAFSSIFISVDVYLLILSCSIILFDSNFNKSSFSILLNFFLFIAF